MSFPIYIHFGPVQIHPHLFFESMAYLSGLALYLKNKGKNLVGLTQEQRLWVGAAALAGAAIGSKLLFWFCDPTLTLAHWNDPFYLMGGKTVVGGFIGGLLGVEWMKKRLGITVSTGDAFVPSLLWGTGLGRLGCFLTGLEDHTCGNPTSLPWAVDFGDGVPRHPTQLYEILWLACLSLILWRLSLKILKSGHLFKFFMVGYLGFRLAVEFIKPGVFLGGLTAIQWGCLLTLTYYVWYFFLLSPSKEAFIYDGQG